MIIYNAILFAGCIDTLVLSEFCLEFGYDVVLLDFTMIFITTERIPSNLN